MTKEHALFLLWTGFKHHLSANWDQYRAYGANLDEACKQIKFSEAVIQQMISDFNEHEIEFEALNPLTLYNYFKTDGFSNNAKKKTLNTFSAFIGHDNWSTFRKKVEKGEISVDTYQNKDQLEITTRRYIPANRTRKRKWIYLSILMAASLLLSFLVWNHIDNTQDEIARIRNVIKAANAAEYAAYRKIPRIDTNNLKKYYVKSGTAYNRILSVLLRARDKNRKLLVPPSSYVVDDIEITELEDGEAEAETTEHWIIRWYDAASDTELSYDTINTHIYYLVNENDSWKISVDAYSGKGMKPTTNFAKKK